MRRRCAAASPGGSARSSQWLRRSSFSAVRPSRQPARRSRFKAAGRHRQIQLHHPAERATLITCLAKGAPWGHLKSSGDSIIALIRERQNDVEWCQVLNCHDSWIRNALKGMLNTGEVPCSAEPACPTVVPQQRFLWSASALQPPPSSSAAFFCPPHLSLSSGCVPPSSASALCDSDSFTSAVHPASRFAFGAASRLRVSTSVFSCGSRPRPAANHRCCRLDKLRARHAMGSEAHAWLVCL